MLGFVGGLLVLAALLRRGRALEFAGAWYASILVFYVITADTSGDAWAFYYHANSVAPAALLMGAGVDALRSFRPQVVRLAGPALVVLACVALTRESLDVHRQRNDGAVRQDLRAACLVFADHLPTDARIAVRGGYRMDAHGHPVAFNESMAYAWLDRKGENYPIEDAPRPRSSAWPNAAAPTGSSSLPISRTRCSRRSCAAVTRPSRKRTVTCSSTCAPRMSASLSDREKRPARPALPLRYGPRRHRSSPCARREAVPPDHRVRGRQTALRDTTSSARPWRSAASPLPGTAPFPALDIRTGSFTAINAWGLSK